jgi:hypothetical protein
MHLLSLISFFNVHINIIWTCLVAPPSSAEVKEWMELYLHSPNTPSWRGA